MAALIASTWRGYSAGLTVTAPWETLSGQTTNHLNKRQASRTA